MDEKFNEAIVGRVEVLKRVGFTAGIKDAADEAERCGRIDETETPIWAKLVAPVSWSLAKTAVKMGSWR